MQKPSATTLWFSGAGLSAVILFLEGIFEPGSWAWIVIAIICMLVGSYSKWFRKPPPQALMPESRSPASSLPPTETIETKMKIDREWCPLSPSELRAYVNREGQTSEGKERRGKRYAGKWLHVRGVVKDVHSMVTKCDVDVRDPENAFGWTVSASMAGSEIETARTLVIGDEVSISGKIRSIGSMTFLKNAFFDQSDPQPSTHRFSEPLDETDAPGWFIAALAATLRDINQENGNTQFSEDFITKLDMRLSQLGEDIEYLRPTKARGMELRQLINHLKRWHLVPPKTSQ